MARYDDIITFKHNYDYDDIDDDRYYGNDSAYDEQDTGELVVDTRSLEKSTKGLRKIDYSQYKDLAKALEIYIKALADKSLRKAIPLVTQKILDDTIKLASERNELGYNDYMGALIHSYKARIVLNGKSVNKTWIITDRVSKWQKVTQTKSGKPIFKILKRRHNVYKHYQNLRWHTPNYDSLHKSTTPKFDSNGVRLKWMDRELNWRGRRLKGKNGGKFRYRVKYTGRLSASRYEYHYYYGKKQFRNGSMYPYFKKTASRNPKDVEVKRNLFRYVNKIDRGAKSRIEKSQLYPNQFRGKIKNGIEIYNVAPYARRVASFGHNVMPTPKVRDAWRTQICTLMQKDMQKMLKSIKL